MTLQFCLFLIWFLNMMWVICWNGLFSFFCSNKISLMIFEGMLFHRWYFNRFKLFEFAAEPWYWDCEVFIDISIFFIVSFIKFEFLSTFWIKEWIIICIQRFELTFHFDNTLLCKNMTLYKKAPWKHPHQYSIFSHKKILNIKLIIFKSSSCFNRKSLF